ncbi:MAG TPA: transcriptional regulator, partial [Steroidobacteraceae bacterium]|nr:transcriptional regulator [Steroidobacteraceae bacterium]
MVYEFGDFELDTSRRVLGTRAGAPVEITGRVLDALIFLVEKPGQLIDKKTLIEALWPNVVVEDGNLTQTIHTLRRVLGEKAGEHRYIVTVPGRGYQFVAEVKERVAPVAPVAPAEPVAPIAPMAPAMPTLSSASAPAADEAPKSSRRP